MPEISLSVTYWPIESEADMVPVIKELLAHGYSGTVTGYMSQPTEDSEVDPAQQWILNLSGPNGATLPVNIGDVVVWNGFAAQVMPREEFDAKTGS